MKTGDCFMLVFSLIARRCGSHCVTPKTHPSTTYISPSLVSSLPLTRSTFADVADLRDFVLRVKDKDASQVPFVLVGNKCDLNDQRVIMDEVCVDFALTRLRASFVSRTITPTHMRARY